MSVRDTSLPRMLFTTLIALAALALAAPAAFAATADPPEKKSEEKKADQAKDDGASSEDAEKKGGETKSAEAAQLPTMGGDASVPRPRTRKPLPTKVDPKTGQKVFVLTNDGLVERFGESKQNLPSAAVPYGETGQQAAQEGEEAAPEEEASTRAVEIRRELRRHRQNLLRYRNPLLPRPQLTEDEQNEQAGRDNVERIAMTESRIAELERELAELQAQGGADN